MTNRNPEPRYDGLSHRITFNGRVLPLDAGLFPEDFPKRLRRLLSLMVRYATKDRQAKQAPTLTSTGARAGPLRRRRTRPPRATRKQSTDAGWLSPERFASKSRRRLHQAATGCMVDIYTGSLPV